MPFIAELRLGNPGESTVKTNLTGPGELLCVSNEEGFHHVKISRAASSIEQRDVESAFWEGVAIDVCSDNGVIKVWADPVGLLPVYYSVTNGGGMVVITDDPKYLIENVLSATEPDVVGFWQALAFETPLRNRTILKNVRQLGGGEKMSISRNGTISISRYWKWDIKDDYYSSLNFEQCVDIACELFDENMRVSANNEIERSERELLLPLSGGADSRLSAVLAARHLHRDRLQPLTYAYSKTSREVAVAKKISDELAFDGHQFHRLTPQSYLNALHCMPRETGGLISFANTHLLDYLRSSSGLSGIVSSGFSDALCGYETHAAIKLPYDAWEQSEKVQKWRSFAQEFKVPTAVDDETMEDLLTLSKAWYESTITTYDEYLYIVERHVKFHLPLLNLWRCHAPVLTPFLSSDLIKLFFSMPPKFRINKVLEHAVIKRLAPGVASIESMSSLVLTGRSGGKFDRLANRGINLGNVALRLIGLGGVEIPSPRITEQLAKALHTTLKPNYADSVSLLARLGLYDSPQKKRMDKPALRVGDRLGTQLTALNCSAVYSLRQ